jgi:tRNA(adenine34) deaminase
MVEVFSEVDVRCMRRALALARRAGSLGEVPVGAVAVDDTGRLLVAEHNRSILACDPTGHAEVLVLRAAAIAQRNYRLTGITLYVTLEPCPMCAGALVWARVKRVVFGAFDPKVGALGTVLDLAVHPGFNHRPRVEGGLLAEESAALLREFFSARR